MSITCIKGVVKINGSKGASNIADDVFAKRQIAASENLVRGTLNIGIDNLKPTIFTFPPFKFESDIDNNLGPLRWWPILLEFENFQAIHCKSFLVRHLNTTTKYLEIMSTINFKNCGVVDAMNVCLYFLNEQ
jgi:hypothetical protein